MDEHLFKQAVSLIKENLSNPDFTTEKLAQTLGISRMHLNRKFKAFAGLSTHKVIKMVRLERAVQLLKTSNSNVTEICYQVGFRSLSHFAKVFKQQYGQTPSEFAATRANDD